VHLTGPGELMYYEPNVEHEYGTVPATGQPWNFHWVHFFPRSHWANWLRLPAVPGIPGLRRFRVDGSARRAELVRLWEGLHRDVRLGSGWRRELAMNVVERILLLVWETLGSEAHRPLDGRVQAALEAISRDPVGRYTVAGLARQVGLSASRFAHLFRQETGMPVLETVLRTRMREAEKLLELTQSPISEIAYRLGFSSPQHFSAQFARRFGMSPRLFRDRAQRDPSRERGFFGSRIVKVFDRPRNSPG
jgi:AraC family transcriptional regulator of arabinose operon